jgi:hypothetical protein
MLTTRLLKNGWLWASKICVCNTGNTSNRFLTKFVAPQLKDDKKNNLELLVKGKFIDYLMVDKGYRLSKLYNFKLPL